MRRRGASTLTVSSAWPWPDTRSTGARSDSSTAPCASDTCTAASPDHSGRHRQGRDLSAGLVCSCWASAPGRDSHGLLHDRLSSVVAGCSGVVKGKKMLSERVISNHFADEGGRPTGGTTFGPGFAIGWQNGPLGREPSRSPQNGAFVEDVIAATISRIEFYQKSPFECEENALALVHLDKALAALKSRTAKREARQVEGTWSK